MNALLSLAPLATTGKARLSKRDILPLLLATFPDYTGRTFRANLASSVIVHDLNWGDGTRNQYAACTLDGKAIGDSEVWNMCAPWHNAMEGKSCPIPSGVVVATWSIFCGRDMGITFYVNPVQERFAIVHEKPLALPA